MATTVLAAYAVVQPALGAGITPVGQKGVTLDGSPARIRTLRPVSDHAAPMAAFWTLLGVFVGIAGKYVVDLKLAKKNKLREEKLKWAVEFLAAASQLAQAVTAQSDWQLELRNTIASETGEPSADQRTARLNRSKEEQTRVRSAWAEAYRANSAVRLLMPAATESAAGYLDLCGAAPDPTERGRDGAEARKEIEATLRDEVYG